MRILLLICAGLIACGASLLLRQHPHPVAVGVGLLLIAIPGVILVQVSLLALATIGQTPSSDHPSDLPTQRRGPLTLFGILDVYRSFKLFLARVAGFVAIGYGIVTWNVYFIGLGAAAVVLFWVWDRMIATDRSTTGTVSESDADVRVQASESDMD